MCNKTCTNMNITHSPISHISVPIPIRFTTTENNWESRVIIIILLLTRLVWAFLMSQPRMQSAFLKSMNLHLCGKPVDKLGTLKNHASYGDILPFFLSWHFHSKQATTIKVRHHFTRKCQMLLRDRISNKFDKRITIANKAEEADSECRSNYRCNFRCNAAIQDELYN